MNITPHIHSAITKSQPRRAARPVALDAPGLPGRAAQAGHRLKSNARRKCWGALKLGFKSHGVRFGTQNTRSRKRIYATTPPPALAERRC